MAGVMNVVFTVVPPASIRERLSNWLPPVLLLLALLIAPTVLSDFRMGLLGKFLTFAILALSLNLIGATLECSVWVMERFSGWAAMPWRCT
jgi:hypothetical protein